jgi:hypothetical protein
MGLLYLYLYLSPFRQVPLKANTSNRPQPLPDLTSSSFAHGRLAHATRRLSGCILLTALSGSLEFEPQLGQIILQYSEPPE